MKSNSFFYTLVFLSCFATAFSQKDSLVTTPKSMLQDSIDLKQEKYEPYNALAPAKAAFYSAILPGLGQAYNQAYWKIPLVYGGLGIGIYFYLHNDNLYDKYRTAYKIRLAGGKDEYAGRISDEGLRSAQKLYQKNKEISLLVTAGIYLLNIIDANVQAHLRQFNVNEDLSLRPNMDFDKFSGKTNYGLSLNLNF